MSLVLLTVFPRLGSLGARAKVAAALGGWLSLSLIPSCAARPKLAPTLEVEQAPPADASSTKTGRRGQKLGIPWLPEDVARFEDEIIEAGAKHDVDPQLIAIIILIESKGNPQARGGGGAAGLMQIMPQTGARIAKKRGLRGHSTSKLMQPAYNIEMGAWYLAALAERFKGPLDKNIQWIAAAYNAGPGKVAAYRRGEAKLADRTHRYRKLVAALWRERNQARSATYERYRAGKF